MVIKKDIILTFQFTFFNLCAIIAYKKAPANNIRKSIHGELSVNALSCTAFAVITSNMMNIFMTTNR